MVASSVPYFALSCNQMGNIYADSQSECGPLVYLYNIERIRAKLFSENMRNLLQDAPVLAGDLDMLLPGLETRLARNSDDILDSFNSFEALLKIVEYISPDKVAGLRSDIQSMVKQHGALFASSDGYSKQVMSMLPESPMWNSVKWKATNIILGKSMNDLMGMLADPCSLRLRCNSRTARGLPMTVSAFFEIPNTDGKTSSSLQEKLQFYTGRSLTDISTSVWSNCILSREPVHGSVTCKTVSGDDVQIHIHSAEDLQGIIMALAYIICEDNEIAKPGRVQQIFKRSSAVTWVPIDGRIQWSRDASDDTMYLLKVTDSTEGHVTTHSLDSDAINGILECLDALALVDSQYSLPMPRLMMNAS